MELPLPAKVDFGNILAPAAAVEGVDGGVVGGGGLGGGGGEVLRRCADADRRHGGGIVPLPALLISSGWFAVVCLFVVAEKLGVISLDYSWGVDLTSRLLDSSIYLKFPLLLLLVLVGMLE